MNAKIQIRVEGKRGCGRRNKAGSLYLVNKGEGYPCGRLPIRLTKCPTCGAGFKPSRGWTWIDAEKLILHSEAKDKPCRRPNCSQCPIEIILNGPVIGAADIGPAGLLWIGEKFYPTPRHLVMEAMNIGISRRIHMVPRGFKVGETWVFLAHRKTPFDLVGSHLRNEEPDIGPGIFFAFKPTAVEVICDGTEDDATVEKYLKRGLTPVHPVDPQMTFDPACPRLPEG